MELDISAYCSREIVCGCGHTHFCPIRAVVIGADAIEKLPALCDEHGFSRVFVAADTNTFAVCGASVLAALGSRTVGTLVFERDGLLVPDEKAVAELTAAMPADTDLVVGVGSGVINDICKYTTYQKGLECAIVATAPSMDGYASSGAAMITAGMKVTYTTHPPLFILADVNVLCGAPMEMIRAGYGDIIGKYSSLNDWKLSALIMGEHFCRDIYDLVLSVTDTIRDSAAAIAARDPEAIAFLMKALVLIGITLSLLGSTRPGSGSEHHLSHFFEIVGLLRGEPYFIHGTDVAYSTVVTASMRERIVNELPDAPVFRTESAEKRTAAWERIYGPIAPEITALQAEAGVYARDMRALYREKWGEIVGILSECPTAAQIQSMFDAVGFDRAAFVEMYGKQKIADAAKYGKDLKNRYSVLWLYYELFSGERDAE